MKLTRAKLFTIIENLLFEEDNTYQDLIDEIKNSKAITKGLVKAYKYITSGEYNPKFLRDMNAKDQEQFLDRLVLELKKIVETESKIKFSSSEGKTDAYARLGTFKKDGIIEFEMILFVDNISKKGLTGNKLAKFIEDKVFHEFMHVENHFANLKGEFTKESKEIMITLDQLEKAPYKGRYNVFQKRSLEDFYNNELNPNTERGIDEIRVRIAQFEANNNLREALEFAKNSNLSAIIKRYGDSDAPWLFMLDYTKGIDELLRLMDDLAKLHNNDVQNFKV